MKKNLIHFFSIGTSIALLSLMGTSAMMPPTLASFLVEEVQGNKALIFNNDFGPFEISFLNCPELKQQTGQYVTAHFGKNTYFDDGDTITFSNGKSCTIQDVDSNFDEDRDLEGRYRGKSCEQAFGAGAYQSPYDNDKSCICKPGYHWNL
ncbi:MAG: hypothetical protein Q4B28_01250 [bacterium]|nr:hypothetical protein [bacterium]